MKNLNYRQKSLIIIAAVLLSGFVFGLIFSSGEKYSFPAPLTTVDEGTTDLSDKAIVADETFSVSASSAARTSFRDKLLKVDDTFTANLPIILIDTNGKRPSAHVAWSDEAQCFLPREGDPYVTGTVAVIDNKNGTNCLTDRPALKSEVRLRRRGNSSVNYDKRQYLLKLTGEDGKPNRQDVLGMGAESEWVLNGSFIDKTQIRNYLAYSLAGEIMPYTPDARFCEVIWKEDDSYSYEGVYLMIENITVGKNRVDLPSFSENSVYLPFLIRRDRYDPKGNLLENYSTRNDLLYGRLDIKWPSKKVLSEESVARITDRIDQFEEALFAEDYDDFIKYRDYIDIDSFVDYFIINEFLINYDAGFNSTYMYSDYSGKLTMGPVWDFDGAMDNDKSKDAVLRTTAFHSAPWFRQMLRDPRFTLQIIERYKELRKSILSDESIQAFIDATVKGLGSAADREWARWGYFYRDGKYLRTEYAGQQDRNTKSFQEEIEKIKYVLSVHGTWMDEHLDSLYQFTDPDAPPNWIKQETEQDWGSLLAVTFIIGFFVAVTLVQRVE